MGTLLVLLLQILYIYMHHSRFCLYQIYMYLSVSDSESLLNIPVKEYVLYPTHAIHATALALPFFECGSAYGMRKHGTRKHGTSRHYS